MGTPILTMEGVRNVVDRLTGPDGKPWTDAERRGFMGYALMLTMDWPQHIAKGTKAKYDRVIREHGIPLSLARFESDPRGCEGWLDFGAGREVRHAA